jgi:NAD(P)-dependent dehydrogenase (short-subunit alcohol dehydrogenase family)
MRAQMAARHPLGRITQPEDVAAAVVWLCSDAASFVTGHSLVIDGGVLAQ